MGKIVFLNCSRCVRLDALVDNLSGLSVSLEKIRADQKLEVSLCFGMFYVLETAGSEVPMFGLRREL